LPHALGFRHGHSAAQALDFAGERRADGNARCVLGSDALGLVRQKLSALDEELSRSADG